MLTRSRIPADGRSEVTYESETSVAPFLFLHIPVCVRICVGGCRDRCCISLPLADSFLVLMIFAAYSCPDDFFTHLRTTEKAPLRRDTQQRMIRERQSQTDGETITDRQTHTHHVWRSNNMLLQCLAIWCSMYTVGIFNYPIHTMTRAHTNTYEWFKAAQNRNKCVDLW